jgi:hypothetical protein
MTLSPDEIFSGLKRRRDNKTTSTGAYEFLIDADATMFKAFYSSHISTAELTLLYNIALEKADQIDLLAKKSCEGMVESEIFDEDKIDDPILTSTNLISEATDLQFLIKKYGLILDNFVNLGQVDFQGQPYSISLLVLLGLLLLILII